MEQTQPELQPDFDAALKELVDEEKRELQKVMFMQGQTLATVAFLRRKGLMSIEDFHHWEESAMQFSSLLTEMTELQSADPDEDEEKILVLLKCAEVAVKLATLLENDPQTIQDLEDRVDQIKKAYPHLDG